MAPFNRLANRFLASVLALAVVNSDAHGQTWITFENETAIRIAPELGFPYNPATDDPLTDVREKDYGVGDFDNDGDPDLVVVRKQPLATTGKNKAYLFLNEHGVLTNRTNAFAPELLTPCNNRDVAVVDVDNDGWLDLVTAPTLPESGDGASVKMPRVYLNLGADVDGQWLGFHYEYADQRILSFPQDPIFAAVSAGDLDSDGDQDLFFVDYASDSSIPDPPGGPLQNRLLLNDGNGFFTDVTETNITASGAAAQLGNGFGTRVWMADMDGDTHLDLMTVDTCSANPRTIRFARNNGAAVFTATSDLTAGFSPYDFDTGDVNLDGKIDFFEVDDGPDKLFINSGNNGSSGLPTFTTVNVGGQSSSTTNGFGGNIYLRDVDADGRLDAIVCDENIHLAQGSNRMALFHGIPNSPWLSASGAANADPFIVGSTACTEPMCTRDTFDVAILDIDLNGKLDLVVGTDKGTKVFLQPPIIPPGPDSTAPAIASTTPGDGTVDHLQDQTPGGALEGIAQISIAFDEVVHDAISGGPVSVDSFTLTLTSDLAGLAPPVITSVAPGPGGAYALTLDRPITPGAWTTIIANVQDTAGNPAADNAMDLGFLPGDVSGDLLTNTQDLLATITGLNACAAAASCASIDVLPELDLNRNGIANTQDLLRLIQLLNGVNTQNPWNGVSLPPQP